MKYVSIDIETTGLDPNNDDIVEFGAVFDDLSRPKPIDQLPTFHAYVLPWRVDDKYKHLELAAQVKHRRYHGDPYALSMHADIFRRIAKRESHFNYYDPSTLVYRFKSWLSSQVGDDKITFCGKNFASFDLQFLNRIPNWYVVEGQYRTLDPTLSFVKVGTDVTPPSTAVCLRRAGLSDVVAHTAIADAKAVCQLLRHALLVHEPADYDSVQDETKPVVPQLRSECREKGCGQPRGKLSVFCDRHHDKFLKRVVNNSPLVKQHG